MAVTSTNVIIGAGTMYVADVGTADANMFSAAYDVGGTSGGVEISYEPEYKDIEVDQEFAPIAKKKIREKMTVKTTMAESTLQNILLAWGLPATRLSNGTLSFGESEVSDAVEKQVYIRGKGPNGQNRTVKLWRCTPQGNATFAFKKDDVTFVNVEFMVLASSTKAGNVATLPGEKMGQIVDESYDGSAPTVTFNPADGATNVAAAAAVTLTFSDEMLQPTLTLANIQIIDSTDGSNKCTGITYNAATKTATLAHANFASNRKYFIKVSTNVKNASGVPLASEAVASFTSAV